MICLVHARLGLFVTLSTSSREAPYCPLCLFPEVKR